MHSQDRWRRIVDSLTPERVLSVDELCRQLGASPATVRRDLLELDRLGRIKRVRGGALPTDHMPAGEAPRLHGQMAFNEHNIKNAEAKRAIGRRAAEFCTPGASIIIDGGSTTFMMAKALPNKVFNVLTTSLPILNTLVMKPEIRITLPGGQLFREQSIVLNPYGDGILENFSASTIFIGAQALTKRGLMQTDPLLVQNERRLIERADQVIVLADSSKFTAPASLSVCPLNDIHTIITDAGAAPETLKPFEAAGVTVIIADGG